MGVLIDSVEAGAFLDALPGVDDSVVIEVGREVPMPEDASLGVALLEGSEGLDEGELLLRGAVVDALTPLVDAPDVGDVDGVGVEALDAVADLILGQELVELALGADDVVVARGRPASGTES